MKTFAGLGLLFIACVLSLPLWGQKQVSFFSDSLRKGNSAKTFSTARNGQFVYIGGKSFDSSNVYAYAPSVSKIDTAGNTLWTFSSNKQTDADDQYNGGLVTTNGYIDRLLLDGDFIYASGYMPGTQRREVWKLQEKTGDLVWKKEFPVYDGLLNLDVTTQDSLLVGYNINGTDGYVYQIWEKRTGRILASKVIPQLAGYQPQCSFKLDSDGSLYFAQFDNIFKFSSPAATNLIWAKQVTDLEIAFLKPEADGHLYAFGRYNPLFASRTPLGAVKLNKSSGNTVWSSASTLLPYYLYDEPSDVKITNASIFISGKQTGFGSVTTAYRVWKLDRLTGATRWDKAYNTFWYQDTIPAGGAMYTSILSLDVDSFENVYASGYQQAGDILSGVWGVCKFDGRTGRKVYQQTIHDGAPYNSKYSRGVYTFVYNNRVFHVGELQRSQAIPDPMTNHGYSNNFIVATDTSGVFNPYRKQKIAAQFQYFSRVAAIKNYSAAKFIVYKQLGPAGMVEMRSSTNGNLLWSKRIARSSHFTADQLCVTADGKIALSAFGHTGSSLYPLQYDYVKKPDSIYFLKLDSLGEATQVKASYIGNQESFVPIHFFASQDTNTIFVYTQKDRYGNNPSLHFFNIDKGTRPIGDFSDYTGAIYLPTQGKQQLLLPITRDTAMAIFYRHPYSQGANLTFQKYKFATNVAGGGILPVSLKFFPFNIRYVTNLAACDSASLVFMGRTTVGAAVISKYNHRTNTIAWRNEETPGYSIEGATCADTVLYWMGRKNNDLAIRQSKSGNGSKNWEYILPAGGQKYYVPVEQKYNLLRKEYTVSGHLVDSTTSTTYRTPFYIILDSAGVLKKYWSQVADYNMENGLSSVEVTQYGQTLVGGALYKVPFGRSGIFIEADSALYAHSNTLTLCPFGSGTLSSSLNGSTYQWQLSTDSINYVNITDNQLYTGSTSLTLSLNQIPSTHYGYWFRCVVDGVAGSNYKLKFANTWIGGSSSAWENPANWSCGSLPDANTDVIINSGSVTLNTSTTIRSLTLLPGANITVATGVTLTIRF